ncbi:MAG: CBS domain-containing protein [Deferrisomatales bacterium]
MKVSQYMSPKVLVVRPDDGIRQTYFRMRDERVRHMPVVGEGGELLGIVSDRDLRRPEWVDEAPDVSHGYELDDSLAVKDLMTRGVSVVRTYDPIRKATRFLLDGGFGALPVLNKEGALVGILSVIDLLRALDDLLEAQAA